jgi:hypothetical protein
MASSYSTSLGIEKMATGDQSGAWGTTTNHNWDILDRISAYTSVAITTNADTATLTVREASPESGTENLQDGMYRVIKFTGALDSNCTVTIAPNTAKVFFIIINATTDSGSSGPYSLILSQGSGANITVGNGKSSVVYCDGAGGGAAVTDALNDLQIGDDLSLASDSSVIKMGADDDITVTHVADVGLKLKQAGATGDDKPFILTLQTGELDIAAADVLGQIDFQAPDEATTGDSQLVAAGIAAISEGDFSTSNNATKLSFKTAASATAAETASLSSTGVFTATSFTGSGAGLTAGTTPLTTLDIDGATLLGEAIVDADLFIIDNGAGGTNRSVLASRIKTYVAGDIRAIEFVIDGGGSAITTGVKGYLEIPFACTINRVTLLADQSGSIVVDIWKDTYANYPPVDGDSITASAVPTISSATKSQDTSLSGWTTAISAGDILGFNVDSISTCTRVTVSLKVTS